LVFLAAFGGWSVVRAFDPAANHTEQPMDLMFLTATSTSATFPPADPWLAGFPISYYYLGYWLVGTLGQLAGQPPELAYNLGQASWFGLLVVGCFGLGFNLARLARRSEGRLGSALTAGGLTALAVGAASNLHFVADWLARRGNGGATVATDAGWWWWQSSRVVKDVDLAGNTIEVITEFPFFSYLLGDNHPHLLSMPFVVLCIGLALNLFLHAANRAERSVPRGGSHRALLSAYPGGVLGLSVTIVVCGALIALNSWDFPAALLLVVAAAVLPVWGVERGVGRPALRAVGLGGLLFVGALVVYLPYFLTAQSQVAGLIPNLFHPTPVGQLALVFGTFAPGLILSLYIVGSETPPRPARVAGIFFSVLSLAVVWLLAAALWARQSEGGLAWIDRLAQGEGIGNPLGIALRRWLGGWPSLVIVSIGLAVVMAVLWQRRGSAESRGRASTFVLLLAGVGLVLVLVPELVYLRDNFGNRMNTVFKFYYLAWLFLGVAGCFGIVQGWRRGGTARLAAAIALLFVAAGLVFPPAAVWSKTEKFGRDAPTLDALAYLKQHAPDELAVIRWVRVNTPPAALIVQAEGRSYNSRDDRISAATGRPTLLGWAGHELQWRGEAFESMTVGRRQALHAIYNPPSVAELGRLLEQWNVDFVYLGPAERERYFVTEGHETTIAEVMQLAFASGSSRLYRRRGS
jgi:YYY domain-containing protein